MVEVCVLSSGVVHRIAATDQAARHLFVCGLRTDSAATSPTCPHAAMRCMICLLSR